jgi:hypothetical protein
MNSPVNPLSSFMRQPKIYIRLPSRGEYWPEGSIELPETGELAVYSMTAKDELTLKIPDALMNGQAMVDVVEHCIPAIKNAWMIPTIDLDVILIAIRMATYGEMMTTPVKFGDSLELEYQLDLRNLMDQLMNQLTWNPVIPVSDELTIFVRPLTYKELSSAALKTFETQKIMQIVNDDKISDDDKIKLFRESFKKLTETTLDTIANSINKIESINGSTDNPAFIKDFVDNIDKELFDVVQKHLEHLKESNTIKPMSVSVTNEMRENGVTGDTVEIPITFDPTTFFA